MSAKNNATNQKATRVLAFMLAIRNKQIASTLKRFGFSNDDLDEGWSLFRNLTSGRLDQVDPHDPRFIAELDSWENRWYPVISAVLGNRFPEVQEWVLRNLSQATGPEVVVTVASLIERLEKLPLPESEGGFGEVGQAARAFLAKRGLDGGEIEAAKTLIERIGSIADEAESDGSDEFDDDEAELKLWKWYLEWSSIARSAIKSRRLLRRMGFLQSSSSGNDATEPTEPGDPTTPPPGPFTNG